MKQENERRTDKIFGGIAIGLGLIMMSGICGATIVKQHKQSATDNRLEVPLPDEGGTILGESKGKGIRLMSAALPVNEYEENGVSAQAENAYTLTATVDPSVATNKAVDWTVAFKNPSSEWATGKTVTDYVTVTPTSDGALTANVANLKAFGEQIIVTVTSRDNPEAHAQCTVDYGKKITDAYVLLGDAFGIGFNSTTWNSGMQDNFTTDTSIPSEMDYTVNYTYSDYTVDDTFTMSATVTLDPTFKSGLSAYAANIENETQGANQGAIVCKELSGSALNLINESEKMYYLGSASGFFGRFYSSYSEIGVTVKKQALNVLVGYIKSLSVTSVNVATLTFTYTGSHSTYQKVVTQTIDPSSLTYAVAGLTLDKSNLLF